MRLVYQGRSYGKRANSRTIYVNMLVRRLRCACHFKFIDLNSPILTTRAAADLDCIRPSCCSIAERPINCSKTLKRNPPWKITNIIIKMNWTRLFSTAYRCTLFQRHIHLRSDCSIAAPAIQKQEQAVLANCESTETEPIAVDRKCHVLFQCYTITYKNIKST